MPDRSNDEEKGGAADPGPVDESQFKQAIERSPRDGLQ